ncbi:8-amino-7-oxononanoate synthase like protein [Verticillium longisporum]|nr:8-amino-7-oxononanoate synthase like protein [Verticillium longisporum]
MSSSSSLERALRQRLEERKSKSQLRRLTSFPSTSVDFSSNSYLSLSVVPEVQKAYIAHLEQLTASNPQTSILGSSGSRLLDGNSNYAEALERDVAAFHHAPAGLLFNSGFDANVGLFSCVPQPGDVVVYDELVHASAHDGMRMSRAAQRLPFKHNTVSPARRPHPLGYTPPARQSLGEILAALTQGASGQEVRAGTRNVFVAVEAVYSMDGDVAPLREIVACIKQHLPRGNCRLIVDEAHSTGLFGLQGRGLVCELGLERDVFARLHTFGKAMGASGGDVVVYDELVHASAHDGMRMSRAAQRLSFKHNTVSPARPHTLGHTPPARQSLSETLAALTQGASGQEVRAGTRNVFVAVEAVYSMDGDVAPLREIVDCIKQHLPRGNGRLIVDEAHSTGLFGLQGRGLVCELGLERDVFARLHTFGKAMGASGAILLCAPVVREYLINYARTLIYTTAMSPASLAGIRVTYDFVATEMADELRRRLRELIGSSKRGKREPDT